MKYSTTGLLSVEGSGSSSQAARFLRAASVRAAALWGELAATLAGDAASRHITLDLHVDDGAIEHDPVGAMRIYKNLVSVAIRLTARDASLCIHVSSTDIENRVDMESMITGAAPRGVRLYRTTARVPSEAGFALSAARAFVLPFGGVVKAAFMENLGVRFSLRMPHQHVRSTG